MKTKLFFLLSFITLTGIASAQSGIIKYYALLAKADSLVNAKNYKEAVINYTEAFKMQGWKASKENFYNAACAWSRLGNSDSAFANLYHITRKDRYMDPAEVIADSDLMALHTDKRWQPLIDLYKGNKEKAEAKLNMPLVHELDTIRINDQKYRQKLMAIMKSGVAMDSAWYARNKVFVKTLDDQDSIDLVQVKAIVDKYGWLGADVVGAEGNGTLFLVIQHSGLKTQEKYLPIMKEAAKNGKASPSDLALLEDRVEMYNGRPQIYGSQLTHENGKLVLYKILDEKNVDKRRAEVGLMPLEEYVKYFGIEYKLPNN